MSSTETDRQSILRLPTYPVEARLILCDGREEEVTLYLAGVTESHPGPESLDEFLNGSRRFLPAKSSAGGNRFLVQRNCLKRVLVDDSAPILSRLETNPATYVDIVRIQMTDSLVLEGTLATTLPPDARRLSDFFNAAQMFIPLAVEDGVTYVNKDYISTVLL